MRVLASIIWLLALLNFAAAQSSQDSDLKCALTAAAEIGSSPRDSPHYNAAFSLYIFYVGRLSGRDDRSEWSAVVSKRLGELKQKAKSESSYVACMKLFNAKLK